jgi:arylsulfatase A-like enzyme
MPKSLLVPFAALVLVSAAPAQLVSTSARTSDRAPLAEPPPRMNVLVVVLDDVGHDLVGTYANDYPCPGCGGATAVPCTPAIDQLAAEGVRFTNAWSSPLCTPTRAQILTGKRAVSLGIGRVTDPTKTRTGLDPDEVTIADLVPVSAAVGKWHLSDPFQTYAHPLECGFDDFLGTMWNLGPPPMDGPSYGDWRKYDAINPPVQQTDYATEETTDDAIARLDRLNQEESEPWLLYVAYHAAHNPFHCAPGHPGSSFPCPTDWWGTCRGFCSYSGSQTCRVSAVVQAMDYHIGRLLDRVDRSDTAVILLGDNGSSQYAQTPPFVGGGKAELIQGGVSVPFIVRAPGAKKGVDVHELVQVSDLFATVADLAQVEVPSTIQDLDSVSFAPYLHPAFGAPAQRDYLYAEIFEPNFVPVAGQPPASFVALFHDRGIRNDKFHLIERVTPTGTSYEFYQLFDATPGAPPAPQYPALTPDPHELNDLMLVQETWVPAVTNAFVELSNELATNYPALPVN